MVDLRQVWTSVVQAADLDQHMAANGQAPVNACLLLRMLAHLTLPPGARILVPGAGTGQLLDYVDPEELIPFSWLFTDINPEFLTVLTRRLQRCPGVTHVAMVDDAENPQVPGPIEAVLAVLVLEHVNWHRALAAWTERGVSRIGCIIQRNEADSRMLAPGRPLTPSMERFRELARPELVPEEALTTELAGRGYELHWRAEQAVPDSKAMIALLHRRCG
jgi:hypothetical protein